MTLLPSFTFKDSLPYSVYFDYLNQKIGFIYDNFPIVYSNIKFTIGVSRFLNKTHIRTLPKNI